MTLSTRINRALDYPNGTAGPDFDAMVNQLFAGGNSTVSPFLVDIHEDANHLYVEAEVPGFKKDEIDITLENATLTIAAEKKSTADLNAEPKTQWLRERRDTNVARSFKLPPTFDENSVQVKLEDGVLYVTLNRREETKPRKIQVD